MSDHIEQPCSLGEASLYPIHINLVVQCLDSEESTLPEIKGYDLGYAQVVTHQLTFQMAPADAHRLQRFVPYFD